MRISMFEDGNVEMEMSYRLVEVLLGPTILFDCLAASEGQVGFREQV